MWKKVFFLFLCSKKSFFLFRQYFLCANYLAEGENDDLESSISNDSHSHEFRYGFFLCYFVEKHISDDKIEEKENWSRAIQCEIGKR